MASMRDIKRRIKSVNSTQQITKAMNLVASSKLTRARNRLLDTRPFVNETRSVIAELINSSGSISNTFLEKRDVKNCIVILITGDRGLCGGYNVNISKLAMNYAEKGKAKAVTIGSKGRDYLKRRNVEIIKSFTGISENPKYSDASNPPSHYTGRILLAEDNDINWEIANELLSAVGLELDWAENGQICLDKFEQSSEGYYDAILMDLRMPVMNGYQATTAIRELNRADAKEIPIIAMTADAFSEDIQRCLECGMNAHIAKPIEIQDVTRQLEKYIKK